MLICTDGLHTAAPSLGRLRRTLSMTPQESGTLRDNLDPFAERTEVQCAAALAHVVGGGSGSNLFADERQLLSIARELLPECEVVCMDEPMSHVNAATAARVQRFVSQAFLHTLIVIAQRLHIVVDIVQQATAPCNRRRRRRRRLWRPPGHSRRWRPRSGPMPPLSCAHSRPKAFPKEPSKSCTTTNRGGASAYNKLEQNMLLVKFQSRTSQAPNWPQKHSPGPGFNSN